MVKKILKYIGIFFLLLLGVLIAIGNFGNILWEKRQKDFSKTLEGMVFEMNKHLPMKIDADMDIGSINHVSISGNSIEWEMEIDTAFFYPDRISQLQPESMNAGILVSGSRSDVIDLDTLLSVEMMKRNHKCLLMYYFLFAKKEKPNLFYEEILRRGFSQKWKGHSPFSERLVEFEITAKEMKVMEEHCKFQKESALAEFQDLYLNRQSELLALASVNSDMNVECFIDSDSFVCRYTLGKEYDEGGNKPIENCRELYDELYEDAKEDLRTIPIFHSAKKIAEEYRKNIIFRYRDCSMNDSIDFVVYNHHARQ